MLDQIGTMSYAVETDHIFAVMAVIPIFEHDKRRRRDLLTSRYRVMFDLQELSPLELEFDREMLVPFKRMMAGLASAREVNKTLFELGFNLEERNAWISRLETYGVINTDKVITAVASMITSDSLYRIRMFTPNYRTVRLLCEERASKDGDWSTDYEKLIDIDPATLEGQTLQSCGKDHMHKLMCSIIRLEPTLRFVYQ